MPSHPTFRFSAGYRAVRAALLGLAMVATGVGAAEHPNTRINYDATRNVNVIDMVMSIDWDFDNPPAGRDKAFIENILKQASQSFYTMTEGRQMLGKVFVYKNSQFMDNTDIQYLQQDGRANAHIAGISSNKGSRNQMFAGTGETAEQQGKTVAHEFGHYIHGIYDEYREEGGTSTEAGSPQDGDTPRDTIMHDHLRFFTISTADDYADASTQKTAHFRTFGKSAWDTLVADPASDPNEGVGRRWFDPFKNMPAPRASTLTKPTTGWENDFQVVWMGNNEASETASTNTMAASGPINIIVIDTSLSATLVEAQRNAAIQVIDAAGSGMRVAVIAHPFSSKPSVPLTALLDNTARSTVKAAISAIAAESSSTDSAVGDRLFDWAESLIPNVFPAGPLSQDVSGYRVRLYSTGQALGVKDGQVYYYDGSAIQPIGPTTQWLPQARQGLSDSLKMALTTLSNVATDADTSSVTLFTTANANVDASLVDQFRAKRVAVNPVAIVLPTTRAGNRLSTRTPGSLALYALAKQTFGNYLEGSKAGDLARSATKAANAAEGDDAAIIAEGESSDILTAGASHSLSARIADSSIDGEATFSAYWSEDDDGNVDFSLIDPTGRVITSTSLPTGITYAYTAGEGEASFKVATSYSNRAGLWTGKVTARVETNEPVFQEVAAKSQLAVISDILGGTNDDKSAMRAVIEVAGPIPVKNATVRVDILSAATGASVKIGLVAKDDGVAPDSKPDDGQYTVSLADLPIGEYEIRVAVSNDGTAVFTTAGATKKGTNAAETPVPSFQRMESDVFEKEI